MFSSHSIIQTNLTKPQSTFPQEIGLTTPGAGTTETKKTTPSSETEQKSESKNEHPSELASRGLSLSFKIPYDQLTLDKVKGKGHSGTVYKGTWDKTTVAIKEFNQSSINYFNAERHILKKLQCCKIPGVVTYAGSAESNSTGSYRIVMEYLPYGTVRDKLKTQNPSWASRYRILINTAASFVALHNIAHVVHRDPKWANVMLLPGDNIKLIDFGFSFELQTSEQSMTRTTVSGTCGHIAPESITNKEYGYFSDVYGFGTMLWSMTTQERPYSDTSSSTVKEKTVKGERLNIPETCPPGLAKLITRCWQQKPADRPTMEQVHEELLKLADEDSKSTVETRKPS